MLDWPRVAGQLAAHGIQECSAALARAGHAGLLTHTGHEVSDNEGHRQHHGKGEQVLNVGDREAESRRHEAEVKHDDVGDRGQDRRAAPEAQTGDNDTEEVNHGEVHQFEMREHCERHGRADDGGGEGPGVALPRKAHGCLRHRTRTVGVQRVLGSRGLGDDGEVERRSLADQLQRGRGPQQRAPAAPLGCTDYQASGVARTRIFDEYRGGRGPIERNSLRAEGLRQPQQIHPTVAFALGQSQQCRGFHVDDRPFGIEGIGHAFAGAHQLLSLIIRSDGYHDAIARQSPANAVGRQGGASGCLDAVGHAP